MKKIKQILIIEDDPVSTYLAQSTLEEASMAEEIILCEHGEQALAYLHNCIQASSDQAFPELILLDLNMPVMNGYEFLQAFMEIKELKGKNIHVVIVSSASFERERQRIENLPASAYIQKPIDEDKLTQVFASLAS